MTEPANRAGANGEEPVAQEGAAGSTLPAWPVETEIYILPSGEVVVADLPAELRSLIQAVGAAAAPIEGAIECESYVVDESDPSDRTE